jgi:hypothetical protein
MQIIAMQLDMHPESDLLRVHATGEFSLREAKRTFLELMEAVAVHKSKKVLLDGRTLGGKPGTIERFYYGAFAAQSVTDFGKRGVSRATQFAYVLKQPVLDPEKFGETVAVNRGMNIKVFDSLTEAFQWLGMAPANEPDTGENECPH